MGYIDNTMMFRTPRSPSPCMKCKTRYTACHDRCSSYKFWSEEIKTKKAWIEKTSTRLQRHGDYHEV